MTLNEVVDCMKSRLRLHSVLLMALLSLVGFRAGVGPSVAEERPRELEPAAAAARDSSRAVDRRLRAAHPRWDTPVSPVFADEVWAKVGQRTCLNCHHSQGEASESAFLLRDPSRRLGARQDAMLHNESLFEKMARRRQQGQSRLLLKVCGELEHGGGEVLSVDSTGYAILKRFADRVNGVVSEELAERADTVSPFFDGVEFLPPRRLLRRTTLSLAGRLPTAQEVAAVERDGLNAMDGILEAVMREDAFYARLQEAFNDILLVRGYDGVAENALSYEHFKNRHWYKERDPGGEDYSDPKKKAYMQLVRNYREAMRREPLELVSYIVRHERPFTEIVTADYLMVSPYTARGYGIFETVQDEFRDPEDPFEFIPARIPALQDRRGRTVQESETGWFPHAGLLSSFQYLMRYPTTETNRNRLRVRMYFQHFLGIDIMQLAPRVSDAAAIAQEYEVPTMQASECVVCHRVIDPIAGLYQDYYVLDAKGIYGPRKDGWYTDMFGAGWEDEPLPAAEQWRALQWLSERTAQDPRFAIAMVKHVWYVLTGRSTLQPPDDIDDPLFAARHRAYRLQRDEIERIATRFVESDFNLKCVFREWVLSPFYRADGLSAAVNDPRRLAELDDVGVVRLLTPEQLERKIAAIFGQGWGRLVDPEAKLNILYGGIDSKEVTERMLEPSGAMGAIQRILANELACRHVAADFALPPEQRRLFPGIEPDVVPGASREGDDRIRRAIVHLHALLLGRSDAIDDAEVQRTFDLFAGIVEEAQSRPGIAPVESYFCQTKRDQTPRDPDPHYTIRAWRGVVTYLLRQHEFLYE